MKNFAYVKGDVATPKSIGPQIVAHVCNDSGIWRGQHADDIYREWPDARKCYRDWYRDRHQNDFGLGGVQFVNGNRTHVNRLVRIANMICTRGTRQFVRYRALKQCLNSVAKKAMRLGASVHLPRIDDRQTDSWPDLESLIQETVSDCGIKVFVYENEPHLDGQFFAGVLNPPVRPRFELYQFRAN